MARLVYIIAALLLWATPAQADPFTIGAFILGASNTLALGYVGTVLVGSLVIGAAGIGLSLISNTLFGPRVRQPAPSDRQAILRQPLGPRVRYYGRNKVGGTMAFFEAKDGFLHQVQTINEGQIQGIVEYWLNDSRVTLDGDGYVNEAPYGGGGGFSQANLVLIQTRLGTTGQTVYAPLNSAFTEVDGNFRHRGVATIYARFEETDNISRVYPQLNPNVRVVADMSIVKSVRTGARVFSDNPADCIYDYLTGVDGAGFAYGAGLTESEVNLASFQDFANLCDQPVPLKAGGTIRRYRLTGGYNMNAEMRDVLPEFLRTCDGDLYMDTDGRVAIRGGQWVAPALTLDATQGHILTADFKRGNQVLAAWNDLTVTYMEPDLDYNETEAERWVDATNIALRGKVLTSQLDLTHVPEHAQARRLAKIATHKGNPQWVGTLSTNFYGFNCIGEETVRIVFPLLGIDTTFLIQGVRIREDFTGVDINVTSLGAAAYAWDAELEEGTAPTAPPDTSQPIVLDPPEDINVSAARRALGGGGFGTFLCVTWTPPERSALSVEAEYRTSGSGTWVAMQTSENAPLAESGLVNEDAPYDVRLRVRSPAGTPGEWSSVVTLAATPDVDAPDPVTGVGGSVSGDDVTIEWTQPDSANALGGRIYRNGANDFGTATLLGATYGSPETDLTYVDMDLASGTYYYWVTAFNGSDFVESTPEASGAITVP